MLWKRIRSSSASQFLPSKEFEHLFEKLEYCNYLLNCLKHASWPICFLHLATNKINATLYAYQDSSGSKTGDGTFHAGLVNLEVKIHKPKDLDKIICDWNFGDGSQLHNSHLTYMSHNFTTVASSTVNVTLRGWSQGQFYVGTASKTLKFTGMIWLSLF